jgi:hypothetical protein
MAGIVFDDDSLNANYTRADATVVRPAARVLELHAALAHVHDGRARCTQNTIFGLDQPTNRLWKRKNSGVALHKIQSYNRQRRTWIQQIRPNSYIGARRAVTCPSYSNKVAFTSGNRFAIAASMVAGSDEMRAASSPCLHAWKKMGRVMRRQDL